MGSRFMSKWLKYLLIIQIVIHSVFLQRNWFDRMMHPKEACSTQLKYLFDCRHEKANQLSTSCNKLKNVTSIMNALFCSLTTTAVCGWSGSSCLNSHRTLDLLFSSTLRNVVPLVLQIFTRHRCPCAGQAIGYSSV